jgi:peptide/nickel transport system ATP-binding protein
MSAPLLDVRNLEVVFSSSGQPLRAVEDVSFSLKRGEVLALVGESGSGKSVTGFGIMGLVDKPGRIAGGQVLFDGVDLVTQPARDLQRMRGKRIAMIFQDPMMTLNPVLRISTQLIEAVQAHEKVSSAEARRRSRDVLAMVGIPSPEERLDAYPHQFSGGMRQRVAIAAAMLHKPELIIADEPTTALDVTIQAQILSQVQTLVRQQGTALIWITHDLAVASRLADSLAVMYAGRIVEQGPVAEVISSPRHPYTAGLIGSVPSRNRRGERLAQIAGMPPSITGRPSGCAFRTRCQRADQSCSSRPPSIASGSRQFLCFHPLEGTSA